MGPRFKDKFVLGFAFTQDARVVLIKKSRPSWQAGRYNGIGGHREPKEDSPDAMEREFFEETGVRIPAPMWMLRGYMKAEKKWHCAVYTVTTTLVNHCKTITDEPVELMNLLHTPFHHSDFLPNIESLIDLCLMRPDHGGHVPLFTLAYE